MLLNCDLGESFGAWKVGLDEQAMAVIDCANIACGFHGGDPDVISNTLKLAKQHQVMIGAHPSYPDLQGFGRRSMNISPDALTNLIHYQVAALDGMAQVQGLSLTYIKPHGALYNDMMKDETLLTTIIKATASYPKELKLMILASAQQQAHRTLAAKLGVQLLFEAFADRLYTDEGLLTSRTKANAVHNKTALMAQVKQLVQHGCVTTSSGKQLPLQADTLCVHGDNEASIAQIKEISILLSQSK
ncbi:5-oxoprolinase subunit A 3 [Pseudoalteromonas holothuriae]|uniref:5-oxoprolinase subunit A 3 n=1 Tax=Pseudoalteromonas holothuriae TaxID=2963714 RepID=A0A9W4R2T3_9GAMM|nr:MULTISPECIES: 5-oxoprolinase subunit PxpA [unclassified Pseudoalteromonas]CAH9063815.1 5-oxoprolinase subunit A 3 [Pseudoalteromonas sp. CIP111854]CAH9064613.1 5-oxoprolinase subunit A 3 [Pseudoalteromonas sp. CIP111951]